MCKNYNKKNIKEPIGYYHVNLYTKRNTRKSISLAGGVFETNINSNVIFIISNIS